VSEIAESKRLRMEAMEARAELSRQAQLMRRILESIDSNQRLARSTMQACTVANDASTKAFEGIATDSGSPLP